MTLLKKKKGRGEREKEREKGRKGGRRVEGKKRKSSLLKMSPNIWRQKG